MLSFKILHVGLLLSLMLSGAEAFRKKKIDARKERSVEPAVRKLLSTRASLLEGKDLTLERSVVSKGNSVSHVTNTVNHHVNDVKSWWPMDGWEDNLAKIHQNSDTIGDVGSRVTVNTGDIVSNADAVSRLSGSVASNAGGIATNAANVEAVGNMALSNAAGIASNSGAIGQLGSMAAQNSASIAGLVGSVGMLSGTVAANSASIASLSAQVAVLGQAAAPTIALANALGVSVSTVATVSLAGSLAAPVLGCMMLVYVCWPDEKNDPWWKLEERVSQMINDRFSKTRRTRLTHRLKRYVKEFSRCSTSWIEQEMQQPTWHPASTPTEGSLAQISSAQLSSTMLSAMQNISGHELVHKDGDASIFDDDSFTPKGSGTPPCMEQLEMHMSLERDEWMSTKKGSLDGLFMPFANLHTQIQSLLTDYHASVPQKWQAASKSTAAGYASFILQHIMDAWSNQVCRTVRLRYQRSFMWWKYSFTVLSPVWQPHAGDECFEACGSKSGWCNYCGGKGVGACCKAGAAFENPPRDPSECQQFDTPVSGWMKKPYHTCVHTDCQQSDSDYKGGTVLSELDGVQDWTECQESCKAFVQQQSVFKDAQKVVFSMEESGDAFACKCRLGDVTRFYSKGVISGPVECADHESKGAAQTDEDELHLSSVPMEETSPCEKSPGVKNLDELETKHLDWMKGCYSNVTKVVLDEFNPFFKRFSKFVDQLSWKAGCGEHPNPKADSYEDFKEVSQQFDHSSFAECAWEKERKQTDDDEWTPDRKRHKGGMFGRNQIDMDEQAKVSLRYPLPAWLQQRQSMLGCLQRVASGGEVDDVEFGSAETNIFKAVLANSNA